MKVFRSADFGKTWTKGGDFPAKLAGGLHPYPFGSVVRDHDRTLRTAVHTADAKQAEAAWMMTSRDDGRSWDQSVKIADGINESVLLPLPEKGWLCVARTSNKPAPELGQELRQFRSTDDGATWAGEGLIAGYHQHAPHLLRLKDNRILLTYGNRRDGSIEARLTTDEAKTWSAPLRLFTTGPGDVGYPSTAQLPDGKLVTVFYASKSPLHDGYHMGALGWTAPSTGAAKATRRIDLPKVVNFRQPERGYAERSPAVVVTCLRSLIGAVALGVFLSLMSRGHELPLGFRGRVTAMLAGGVVLAGHWWAFFMAIRLGSVSLGLLTYASYPLFVTVLNWLLKRELIPRKDWWAALAVIIGLGLVVPDWNFGSQAGRAAMLGLASGLTFALLTLLNRQPTLHVPPLPLVVVQLAAAGLILLPLAIPQIPKVTAGDWLWMLLLGVACTGVAHACFTSSLKTVRVAVVGVAAALEPVYGMLAAWLFLGESPTMTMLTGATFIIGASFLSLLPGTIKELPSPTSPS